MPMMMSEINFYFSVNFEISIKKFAAARIKMKPLGVECAEF